MGDDVPRESHRGEWKSVRFITRDPGGVKNRGGRAGKTRQPPCDRGSVKASHVRAGALFCYNCGAAVASEIAAENDKNETVSRIQPLTNVGKENGVDQFRLGARRAATTTTGIPLGVRVFMALGPASSTTAFPRLRSAVQPQMVHPVEGHSFPFSALQAPRRVEFATRTIKSCRLV